MISFIPGPSELYFTVPDHVRRALRDGIGSISHRSKTFQGIFKETTDSLRILLNLPPEYGIVFTGSATEIWERLIQNLVETQSFHYVNGAFSQRFQEIAQQLGKDARAIVVPPGQSFSTPPEFHAGAEVIALTHNETSTGVALTNPFISEVRRQNPQTIIAVDGVSSLPYPGLDYQKIDSAFFSVQKAFGLPAGLGVWIYNQRCLEKASLLQSNGINIGTYHSLLSLDSYARKHQTPETPNVLAIYLLGKVVNDFLRRGIDLIRNEITYKSTVVYQTLDDHPTLKAFVTNPADRSATVITVQTGNKTAELSAFLQSRGLQPGDGYGKFQTQQLRFANFPAHSKEVYHTLADAFAEFK